MDADVYPFDPPGTVRVTLEIIPQQISTPRIPMEEGSTLQADR
jgi:hypothetical protein